VSCPTPLGDPEVSSRQAPRGRSGFLLDLHNHTHHSHDGILTPAELLKTAAERGIACVGVTDHGTIRGGLECAALAAEDPALPQVICGQEVFTEVGEIIGLYLSREIPSGSSLEESVRAIREQGGIVYLPHPFDSVRRATIRPEMRERAALLADVIEVANGRSLRAGFDAKALQLATRTGRALGAGSDAHYKGEVGRAVIEVERMPSRDDVVEVLRHGRPIRSRTLRTELLAHWFLARVGADKLRGVLRG